MDKITASQARDFLARWSAVDQVQQALDRADSFDARLQRERWQLIRAAIGG